MTMCEPQSGGEILCIRLSGLGDVVHTMNALSLLEEYRPNANITWVIEERFSDLLEGHPYIDELLTIPRQKWSKLLKNPLRWGHAFPEIADLVLELRRHEYDVSLDFQSSLKSAWLVSAAGAKLRVGFGNPVSREMNYLSQNELVEVPGEGVHRIERDLALLGALGIPTQYARPIFPRQRKYTQPVEWVTEELPRPLVLMHPGTSDFASFKRWAPEHYGHVAEWLMDEKGAGVLVTFGPGEEALAHRLVAASSHRAVLAPRLAHLQQLTYLLSKADLFVGSDTGPMHLASGLGIPVVALFGPKDADGTGPYCSRSRVVAADVPCRPCDKRQCGDPVCMSGIEEEEVQSACDDLLTGEGKVRGVEGQDVRGPFTVNFALGIWDGAICTSYSRPEFYRFLTDIMNEQENPDQTSESVFCGRGRGGRDLVLKIRKMVTPRMGLFSRCRLKNFWDRLIEMRWDGLAVPEPVCYIRGKAREGLVFERRGTVRDVRELTKSGEETELINRTAELLHRMHSAGYYHRALSEEGSINAGTDGSLTVDHLESAWNFSLPLLGHEAMVGADLGEFCEGFPGGVNCGAAARLMKRYEDLCDGYEVQQKIIASFAGSDVHEITS